MNLNNSQKPKRGVTLIELLIVIVLLGVLSTLVAGNLMTSLRRGRDARRKADLNGIAKALELYYADYEAYPSDNSDSGSIYGCGEDGTGVCVWGSSFATTGADGITYMIRLPQDPNGGSYWYNSTGTGYRLYANLENEDDPEYNATGYCGAACGGNTFSYGIASVNELP